MAMTGKYFHDKNTPSLEEVLDNREQRIRKIKLLEKKFPELPVICFKLNIPGKEKTNESVIKIFEIGIGDIKSTLGKTEIVFEKQEYIKTGPEFYMVASINPRELKTKMIYLEENSYFGRLYDIDILYQSKNIDRETINMGPRKCFLCDNDAKLCARSRKHSVDEMINWIENLIDNYERMQ